MRVTLSQDPRDFVRRDWSDLVAGDPSGTFFHTPRYLKLYWEEFGGTLDLLLVFAEEDEGRRVGAAAFERLDETIRFLGGTEVTDYMGPVAAAGAEEGFAKQLFAVLADLDGWRRADLSGLPRDSAWLARLRDAAAGVGLEVEVTDDGIPVAPLLGLPESYDEYLAALPAKLRHEIRRKARKLEAATGGYRIAEATAESLGSDLDRFVALHRSSEGPKGKFLQPGMEIFFRRLGEAFLPDGVFRMTFVEAEGIKLAGTIGFRFGDTYSLYNSAYDHAWRQLSPGMVLVGDLIERAIEEGCQAFDMLKGDYDYKYRFGAVPRGIGRLIASRA